MTKTSRAWRWVNALAKRLENHADDNRPTIATDSAGEPFIIWDSWSQVQRVHKIAGLIGTDHDGEPFSRDEKYPEAIDKRLAGNTGFGDEWAICDDCYQTLIRTQPDCYSWTPDFHVDDNGITCSECMEKDPEAIIESCMNENRTLPDSIHPDDHGWWRVNPDSYESGCFPGQVADPSKILDKLGGGQTSICTKTPEGRFIYTPNPHKLPHIDCVFSIDEASQFYSWWSVWVRGDDLKAARERLNIPHTDETTD